jgi:hypothetical protein
MVKEIVSVSLIVLVYLCLLIVMFAPTLYALWLYILGKKVKVNSRGLLRTTLTTFLVNAIVVYFVAHLAFGYLLPRQVAEKDALAAKAVENAVDSQKRYFAAHGRYYAVGPVRGPYRDEQGLVIDKDVILQVVPGWEKTGGGHETFEAYAVHVWGRGVALAKGDGSVLNAPPDAEESVRMRAKLLNSVRCSLAHDPPHAGRFSDTNLDNTAEEFL